MSYPLVALTTALLGLATYVFLRGVTKDEFWDRADVKFVHHERYSGWWFAYVLIYFCGMFVALYALAIAIKGPAQ